MDLVQYQADRALGGRAPTSGVGVAARTALLEPGDFTLIASLPLDAPPEELTAVAEAARSAGARLLLGRAAARTGAHAGDPLAALRALAECGRATGLACVAEVVTPEQADRAVELVEMLQVGTGDPDVLAAAARSGLPVLLARGPGATVDEWLAAADRLAASGGPVTLSAPATGPDDPPEAPGVDLAAVPVVRERSGLPVVVDPSAILSAAVGSTATVVALTRAAAAVGADGVVVQTAGTAATAAGLGAAELTSLVTDLQALAALSGRRMATRRIRYVGRRS